MMPRPATRSNRQNCDGLRFCTTPRERLSPRFRRVVRYPPMAALTIDPEINVMGHNLIHALPQTAPSFDLFLPLIDRGKAVFSCKGDDVPSQ
jgi:hypothetical protein